MISPWSTNAVEICKNMGLDSILRIEKYIESKNSTNDFDPMLNEKFESLSQSLFKINLDPKSQVFLIFKSITRGKVCL